VRQAYAHSLVENPLQGEILRRVLHGGASTSRARLTQSLGVSKSKVAFEVRRLVAAGLLAEDGFADSEGGRRSSLLHVPHSAGFVGVFDLGATSTDVAVTTLSSDIVAHRSEPSDIAAGPRAILERAVELLDELLLEIGAHREQLVAVGVGVPGPVEQPTGRLVAPPIMPGWDDFGVRAVLEEEFHAPVAVDNDVNIMALGEHARGVGQGVENLLFVKIGTGIGGGIVIGGEIYRGAQGCAGDIGHLVADVHGPICACGNIGCLEALAAAPAIVRAAEHLAREGSSQFLAERLIAAGGLEARDVGDAASRGDYEALTIIRDAGRLIGQTLASVVSVLNPSLIVIGGGVSQIGNALLAEIRTSVYKRSLPLATRNLPIVLSQLEPRAGVIGASVIGVKSVLGVPTS
jgi:glucokinase-like ROK family protein